MNFLLRRPLLLCLLLFGAFRQMPPASAAPLWELRYPDIVYAAAFSPDGRLLAIGTGNSDWDINTGSLDLRDAKTGRLKRRLKTHANVWRAVFSPDGRWMAAIVGSDGQICLWDTRTWRKVSLRYGDVRWNFHGLVFSPDSHTLVTDYNGGQTNALLLWDVKTGRLERKLTGYTFHSGVQTLAFSSNGRWLAGAANSSELSNSEVLVFDVSTGRVRSRFETFNADGSRTGEGFIKAMAFLPGQESLLCVGDDIGLHNPNSGALQRMILAPSPITSAAVTNDLRAIFVGEALHRSKRTVGRLRVFDRTRGRWNSPVIAHAGAVMAVSISRDGKRVASGGSDGKLKRHYRVLCG